MATQPDPRLFQFGNAFLGGMDMAQQNQRRNALIAQDDRALDLRERMYADEQAALQAQGQAQAQQSAASREALADLFRQEGLPAEWANLPERQLQAVLENHFEGQNAQPELIEDQSGQLVPKAAGVRPYHAPREPKAPGTLYQIVGPDGKPQYVSADQALGQQPFIKSDKPPVAADPAAQVQDAENVLAAINNAKSLIGWNTTGFVGQKLGEMGGTDAYDLRSALDTVKASIGFDRLQRMREESKTGGALGQVAVRELDLLQATIASIDANQSGAQLGKNLDRVQKQYEKAMTAYQKALGGSEQPAQSGAYADADKERRYQEYKRAHGGG